MKKSLQENIAQLELTPEKVREIFRLLQLKSLANFDEVEEFLRLRTIIDERLSQEMADRYIAFAKNTTETQAREQLDFFVEKIDSIAQENDNALDAMLIKSKSANDYLRSNAPIYLKQLQRRVELFRTANVALMAEEEVLSQEYAETVSTLAIEYNGKSLTMQEASSTLELSDRSIRHKVYLLMLQQRLSVTNNLHDLMDELLKLRYRIAVNAGFKNYRDYRHLELERFSYSVAEVQALHQLVVKHFVPIADKVLLRRKQLLGVAELKPWDLEVDPFGVEPLKPFDRVEQLVEKGRSVLELIDARMGTLVDRMATSGHMDLESRHGKVPGAFSYPLPLSKSSFLFMNAAGVYDDVVTFMHEMGHAFHEQLCSSLPFSFQKDLPIEVAELASMSMELISSSKWNYFYGAAELKRAKSRLFEEVALALPWIVAVDEFQHWLYTHPEHSHAERDGAWTKVYRKYVSHEISWLGVEEGFVFAWQRQLHIFEDPFYYIEYAIAQLGALELYQQFTQSSEETLQRFTEALELGGSIAMEDLYAKAGLRFSCSEQRIIQLANFLEEQLMYLWE
ncbi:MAG TPA: M3 family oligoendopeptidase [Williamwhitmania sp.]|nr:M3 family oligoendopeptidase [Williamwhitmania sp.]